jgi:hypothetical protein
MYLSHVMNFYTEERWITYKDPSGEKAVKSVVGTEMIIPAKLTVVSAPRCRYRECSSVKRR